MKLLDVYINNFLKNFEIFKLIISTILLKKNFVLISTPLQLINFLEYKNHNKNDKTKLDKAIIFISNSYKQEVYKIISINNVFNTQKNKLLNINQPFFKFVALFFLNIRNIFLNKIEELIVGNYANPFFSKFYKISNKIFFLDDGFSTLFYNKKIFLGKNKFFFFSFMNKKIFLKKKNFIKNEFNFIKKKIKKKIKVTHTIFVIGRPSVETNYLSKKNYFNCLVKLRKVYSKYKIYYFPHPKELYKNYKNYKFYTIIKTKWPLELYLLRNNFLPEAIVGFNTTCFLTISKLFGNKVKFANYYYDILKKNVRTNENVYNDSFKDKQIQNYLKVYLKIKTKLIRL